MVLKFFYVIYLLLRIFNLVSCKSTKCCLENQKLNSTLNGCVSAYNMSDINFNISDFKSDASFYNISSNVINLPCSSSKIKVLMSDDFVISDNFILTPKLAVGVKNFNSSEYCLDEGTDVDGKVALTCPCLRGTCVQVCCGPGQVLDQIDSVERYKCVPADEDEWLYWRLENSSITDNVKQQLFHTVYDSHFKCNINEQQTVGDPNIGNITVDNNGSLREYHFHDNASYETYPSEYCLGAIKLVNDTIRVNAISCLTVLEQVNNVITTVLYSTLNFISSLFLLATLVVYIMLPELQRSVQGLSLMSHCAFMLIAHITIGITQLIGDTVGDVSCKILAYVIQISFLTGFFWMNVMCIDISSKFRYLRTNTTTSLHEEIRKFLYYSIYAIGVPFLIFFITIALDFSDNIHEKIRPDIGNSTCWFSKESTAIIIFFYGPIGLLLVFNLILFLFTSTKIVTFSRGTSILQRNNTSHLQQRHSDTKSFKLFLKLFGLMGIPWVMEIISWAVGGKDYYWYIPDSINLLRSVFIFILFCCKKKVKQLVQARYPWIFTAIRLRNTNESSSSEQRNQANNSSQETQETANPERIDAVNLTPIQQQEQEQNNVQNDKTE